jgi:hypothetical protein
MPGKMTNYDDKDMAFLSFKKYHVNGIFPCCFPPAYAIFPNFPCFFIGIIVLGLDMLFFISFSKLLFLLFRKDNSLLPLP